MNTQTIFDNTLLVPENEPADAREIREAFLQRLGPLNPVQAFYLNFLVRGAVTTLRAEIIETIELTRAIAALEAKHQSVGETPDTRRVQALALRAVSRDFGRLHDLLKFQSWGSREITISLRDIASSTNPFPPPTVPSCRQDLVEDPELSSVAPPLPKAA